ncbi:glycosyltransferase family 39 protein [bacterium]|nr:glycosyltransferase family 39 protein [bacterium]
MKRANIPKSAVFLGVAIAAGAFLRFFRLPFGLPDVLYVDAFKFVDAAREMVAGGDWTPKSFQYPGFFTNLLALVFWMTGAKSAYATHLIAAAVSALFGTGLILITYFAARQACGRAGAILAAALTAFSIAFVTLSRIPATDCILSFFMTAGVWMLARENAGLKHLFLAGVFLGLAIGTKFTGLFLAGWMLVAIAAVSVRSRKLAWPVEGLLICALLAFIALIVTTPFLLTRFALYWQRFAFELQIQRFGQIGRVQYGFFDYFISSTPTWEMPWLGTSILYTDGAVILGLGVIGCMIALSGRFGNAPLLHALYVLMYLALICRPGSLKAIRFLAPILPSFYIMAAWALERAAKKKCVWAFGAVAMLAFPIYKSLDYLLMTRCELTQVGVARWMQAHVPKNSAVFVSPFFLENLEKLGYRTVHVPEAGSRQYRVLGNVRFNTELMPIYDAQFVDDLANMGVRYVVTNSYFDAAFSDVRENRRWFQNSTAAFQGYLDNLKRRGKLVFEIEGQSKRRIGPDVRVYQLGR